MSEGGIRRQERKWWGEEERKGVKIGEKFGKTLGSRDKGEKGKNAMGKTFCPGGGGWVSDKEKEEREHLSFPFLHLTLACPRSSRRNGKHTFLEHSFVGLRVMGCWLSICYLCICSGLSCFLA